MRSVRARVAVVSAIACACAAAPIEDPLARAPAPDPEAEASGDERALAVRPTGDAARGRPPEAILAWGFEPASADCNGWSATGATSIRATPSHSGTYACKLCADGKAEEMTLSRRVGALPAGRYLVTAWVRLAAAPDATSIAVRVSLDGANTSAGVPSSILVKDRWLALSDPLEVTADIASAHVIVAADHVARGACILVDDVVVDRARSVATPR